MKKARPKETPFWRETRSLDEKEVLSNLIGSKGSSLFLGRYTMNEVTAALGRKNFLKEARKRQLWPLEFDLDSSEYPLQRLRIFCESKNPEKLIVDLKIKEGTFLPKKKLASSVPLPEYKFLILEWLTLQNPLLDFSGERTPLPGQKHPGLNLGRKVLDIFIDLARLTGKEGLLAFPAYFHNALLFFRYFHFLNPEKQGEVEAIRNSFPNVSFKQLAWIVYLGCLQDKKGKRYEWKAEEMIYPLKKTLKDYFDSKAYRDKAREQEGKLAFEADWHCFKKKMNEQPIGEEGLLSIIDDT